jgi:hypothetical protein
MDKWAFPSVAMDTLTYITRVLCLPKAFIIFKYTENKRIWGFTITFIIEAMLIFIWYLYTFCSHSSIKTIVMYWSQHKASSIHSTNSKLLMDQLRVRLNVIYNGKSLHKMECCKINYQLQETPHTHTLTSRYKVWRYQRDNQSESVNRKWTDNTMAKLLHEVESFGFMSIRYGMIRVITKLPNSKQSYKG